MIAITLSCVGLCIILIAGSILCSPHPSIVGAAPSDIPAVNVSFPSQNGAALSGWYLPGKKAQGGVLLMHGVKSNRLQMLDRARFLNKAGYSVLLFDFQGHGESIGKHITFGYLEAQDAQAAFTYLHNKLSNKSIGVIGVSLGGAAALLGPVLTQADALVLESVYPTILEAIANRLRLRVGTIGGYLSPLLLGQIQPRLGFDPSILKPIERISHATGAILIITGSRDQHTTLAESTRLFHAAPQPKQFWAIPGAAHVDFRSFTPNVYQHRVLTFMRRHLPVDIAK